MRKRSRWLIAAAAAVVVTATAGTGVALADTVRPKIVGGVPATAAYPFAVSMQIDSHSIPDWHLCGGTLVAPSWVETNAHCVTNPPTSGARVAAARQRYRAWASAVRLAAVDLSDPSIFHLRIGSLDRLHGGVVRHVTAIHVHPSWAWGVPDGRGRIGDIALLHLDKPVTSLRPALVDRVRPRAGAREIGWGLTRPPAEWGDGPAPEDLSEIGVPVRPNSACRGSFIGAGELCLGPAANGGGACAGDSGSPALQRLAGQWVVAVGSASRGPDDDTVCGNDPMVYTSTAYYAGWMIRTALGLPAGASTAGRSLADAG